MRLDLEEGRLNSRKPFATLSACVSFFPSLSPPSPSSYLPPSLSAVFHAPSPRQPLPHDRVLLRRPSRQRLGIGDFPKRWRTTTTQPLRRSRCHDEAGAAAARPYHFVGVGEGDATAAEGRLADLRISVISSRFCLLDVCRRPPRTVVNEYCIRVCLQCV